MDRVATRFSVFWYFKRNENIISGILADLLRTDGSHGQGSAFLELFLKEIDRDRGDARYRKAKDHKVADGCTVQTEHVIGGKRRIDIVVRLGETRRTMASDREQALGGRAGGPASRLRGPCP